MIKEKELKKAHPSYKYSDGREINISTVRDRLQDAANEHGVDVDFYLDEVKYGGVIGGDKEECLVLYHPYHRKDYIKFCIRVRHQGNFAFVTVDSFGKSKQFGNTAEQAYYKDIIKRGAFGDKILAIVISFIRRILGGAANKRKVEEEQMWYSIIKEDVFAEVIS